MTNNPSKLQNNQLNKMSQTIDQINKLTVEITLCQHLFLGGEIYITDAELSKILKVSRRTTQEWRNKGKISYISLGGKILYRESDIETMLNINYCYSFERY